MSEQPLTTCPNCGATPPPGATFCPNCGHALSLGTPDGPPPTRGPLSPDEIRTWAIGAHVSAVAGALIGGLGSFAGPLVVWLMYRERDPYVTAHALEALNFNITIDVLVAICYLFGFVTLGFGFILAGPLLLAIGALWLYGTIMGASAASRGEAYRYPLSVRLVT